MRWRVNMKKFRLLKMGVCIIGGIEYEDVIYNW